MEKYNINNGLIGINKYTLIKLIEVMAMNEYKKGPFRESPFISFSPLNPQLSPHHIGYRSREVSLPK
jgi:hypothetical protein